MRSFFVGLRIAKRPYIFRMEETIRQLIERGSIKVSDNIFFKTKAECASLFGKNYLNILKGGILHPIDKKIRITFWQEGENELWENTHLENPEGEIIEFTERRKKEYSEWVSSWKDKDKTIIFYKKNKEGYKFRGIFSIDFKRSTEEGRKIWKVISNESRTYPSKNIKPLRDLKDLLLAGKIKENEEIYLTYRGIEYSGRVTSGGKIRTQFGEFSPSKAAVVVMTSNPDNERNKENANGYYQWKTWNDVPIGDLRKI